MMLNNIGNGMPINAQCASMVTNVTGPLHLQSPVGNGNSATLMLHQQQLHVTGNLSSSNMQSPNNVSGNSGLNLTPGKICPRSILQHPIQIPQGYIRIAYLWSASIPNFTGYPNFISNPFRNRNSQISLFKAVFYLYESLNRVTRNYVN